MKKYLSILFTLALALCTAPTYADDDAVDAGQVTVTWTAPLASFSDIAGSSLTSDNDYYLYNVGAEMCFVNGNAWSGAEASLGSVGLKVKLTSVDEVTEDDATEENPAHSAGYTIQIVDAFTANGQSCQNTYVYYNYDGTYGAHYWCDLSTLDYTNDRTLFNISETTTDSKVYRIKGLATDETNDVTFGYLGWDGDADTEVSIALTDDDGTNDNAHWLLLSADDYEAACQALVDMRQYLNNALLKAQELGLTSEAAFLKGIAVYQAESSQEEIDEATEALAELIQQNATASGDIFEYKVVTGTTTDEQGNEVDVTETTTYRKIGPNLIANPDFSYGIACWTTEVAAAAGSGTDNTLEPVSWDYFSITQDTDGGYYMTSKTNSGTPGDGTLVTEWEIDPSKTYYFSCSHLNLGVASFDVTTYTNSQGSHSEHSITSSKTDWGTYEYVFSPDDEENVTINEGDKAYALVRFSWNDKDNGSSWKDFELCEVELLADEEEDEISVIVNPDFSNETTGNGWTEDPSTSFTDKSKGFQSVSTEFTNDVDGDGAADITISGAVEAYVAVGSALSDRSLTQEITLDAGEYRLTADIIATQQSDPNDNVKGVYLIAGDEQTSAYTGDGVPETFSVDFAVAEDNSKVTIGLKLVDADANWVVVDNFTLTNLGTEHGYDVLELTELIDEATELYDDGTGTGADDLKDAIDAAQAVLDNLDSSDADYAEAISSLKEAMEIYKVKNNSDEEVLFGAWTGASGTQFDGAVSEYFSDSDKNADQNGTITPGTIMMQTITGLPAGTYDVEIYCAANYANHGGSTEPGNAAEGDEVVTITANGVTQAVTLGLKSAGDYTSLEDDLEPYTLTVIVAEDGTINLSISVDVAGAANWVIVRTNSVKYVGEAPSYDDLQDALEAAKPLVANVGDDTFQIPTADAEELLAAIETAEALGEDATISEIASALTALTSATEAFEDGFDSFVLNAPGTTQTFHIVMLSESSGAAGNALTYIPDESVTQGGIAFQFISEPNANLANQVFNFTAVAYSGGKNAYTIEFFDENRTHYYLCTGKAYDASNGNAYGIRATTDVDNALTIQVKATTTEGVWKLVNTEVSSNLGINPNGDSTHSLYTNDQDTYCDLAMVNADEIEWTLEADYGTLILPFAPTTAEIDGLTFYSTSEYASGDSLSLEEVSNPEAGVPYIVSGEPGTYKFEVTNRVFTSTSDASGWLTGAYESTEVPTDSYVLQDGEEGLAFYVVTEDDPITLTPNHCYLTVSSTSDDETTDDTGEVTNAPAVIFFPNGNGNSATAITGVEANVADAEAVYDLSGRKVSQAQKGIYIKGGKKVVIK